MIVFIDDILVYSKSSKKHESHLRIVLQTLRDHKLFAKSNEFCLYRVTFLGHMIFKDGIFVDPKKVEAVVKWPRLVRYYRRFVEGISKIVGPLTKLTQKYAKFEWNDDNKKSFKELKDQFVFASVLTLLSSTGGFIVYSDLAKMSWLCAYAEWKGDHVCIKTTQATRAELSHSQLEVGNRGFCIENLETLSVWEDLQDIFRPQEPQIHILKEIVKSQAEKMD